MTKQKKGKAKVASSRKNLQKQVDELQKQVNELKKSNAEASVKSKGENKPSLLSNIDPAKLSEWLNLLSNPAVQDLISQWRVKSVPVAEEPPRRRRRRLFS
ncbi:hypothetical protein [Brevibacillus fulvus]|uniref:Seryl-tRNA synthetase n=1 Tax=Brevibacillus fulvus TaxID=1125967 RepID=A0A938XYG4_9BACL|nr:hypothetical protein [Brevibacillus fulvus]MBM7590000.1 seryl-tRNA synthetase [Brevibacillus fulvus]